MAKSKKPVAEPKAEPKPVKAKAKTKVEAPVESKAATPQPTHRKAHMPIPPAGPAPEVIPAAIVATNPQRGPRGPRSDGSIG